MSWQPTKEPSRTRAGTAGEFTCATVPSPAPHAAADLEELLRARGEALACLRDAHELRVRGAQREGPRLELPEVHGLELAADPSDLEHAILCIWGGGWTDFSLQILKY